MGITSNYTRYKIEQQIIKQKRNETNLNDFAETEVLKSVEDEYKKFYDVANNIFNNREKLIEICLMLAKDLKAIKETSLSEVKQKDYQTLVDMSKLIITLYEV